MKTAVIYARYSSSSQTEQSIEGQLDVCRQYAKDNGLIIVDTRGKMLLYSRNFARHSKLRIC